APARRHCEHGDALVACRQDRGCPHRGQPPALPLFRGRTRADRCERRPARVALRSELQEVRAYSFVDAGCATKSRARRLASVAACSGAARAPATITVAPPAKASPMRGLQYWHTQPTNGPPTTVVPSVSK